MRDSVLHRRYRLGGVTTDYRCAPTGLASLAERLGGRPAVAVVDRAVVRLHAERLAAVLRDGDGAPLPRLVVAGGEAAKTVANLERAWEWLAARRLTRDGVVVGVGGGAVLDLAGFAAATWQRGVRFVAAPTTLLAAVDAGLGGKTAVDLGALKNPVGAFHPATDVLVETDLLGTLTRRDWRCGLAETVKAAVIAAAPLFRDLEARAPDLAGLLAHGRADRVVPGIADLPWTSWIDGAVRVKGRLVALDFREAGPRRALNLGHTLGHALELQLGLAHGEAVALGLAAAARLAAARGTCPRRDADRIVALLAACGLAVAATPPPRRATAALVAGDKKARGGEVRWVLPLRIGAVDIDARVGLDDMLAALSG
ncbi:MAG: 3-dehydroquinate synthase [Gemmatimonas sp.]|nr:3-dehydroquinate synthase [Gemmatimonas sp.]